MGQVVERMEVHPESLFYHEHAARYHFAKTHIRPGSTLDIACGTGYGVHLLGQYRNVHVVGADIYSPALSQARKNYPDHHLSFIMANGTGLPFQDNSFQNIVTLETIEHIVDDRAFLQEIFRILIPDGVCVLSTPNRDHSIRHNRVNPYHVREYSSEELLELLGTFCAQIDLFYQGFSIDYYQQVNSYVDAIQINKQKLNPVKQLVINRIYRPIKRLVPPTVTSFFIHKWLKLDYPHPDLTNITISPEPVEDTSVFITVCRKG